MIFGGAQDGARPATVRVIGLALAACDLDVALLETDGVDLVRRIEVVRIRLDDGATASSVSAAVLRFLGDRALQPFAIDLIGLAAECHDVTALQLGRDVGCEVRLAPPDTAFRVFEHAERVALSVARVTPRA